MTAANTKAAWKKKDKSKGGEVGGGGGGGMTAFHIVVLPVVLGSGAMRM